MTDGRQGGSGVDGGGARQPEPPDDRLLIARLLDGDQDAVRTLVNRYDRLIRYTIFKTARRHCERDPGWLDARANEAWTGIVQALRRTGAAKLPPNLPAYFAQITRNKCLDAARKADARTVLPLNPDPAARNQAEPADDPDDNPLTMLESLEQLEALRDCIARLSEDDQLLCAEIGLIMERRWSEAAARLGMAESTLRSRWDRVLGRLRACLEKKTKKNPEGFAPGPGSTDS